MFRVCEALMRDAGKRGLRGAIIRPGYVTAESTKGTTVTDDFLVRILKGCDQIHSYPDLGDDNFINCMPVDGVARICIAAASSPPPTIRVLNATARSLTYTDYLGALSAYGYRVGRSSYEAWAYVLEDYVATTASSKRTEHALLPLYHLAVTDLPNDSKSPPLDNANVKAVLEEDKKVRQLGEVADHITAELVGRSLSYLVEIGFMDAPKGGKGKLTLPKIELSQEQRDALAKIGGRGAIA
jgi:L-aminoadipate-semialdehyde dehydrogenase